MIIEWAPTGQTQNWVSLSKDGWATAPAADNVAYQQGLEASFSRIVPPMNITLP